MGFVNLWHSTNSLNIWNANLETVRGKRMQINVKKDQYIEKSNKHHTWMRIHPHRHLDKVDIVFFLKRLDGPQEVATLGATISNQKVFLFPAGIANFTKYSVLQDQLSGRGSFQNTMSATVSARHIHLYWDTGISWIWVSRNWKLCLDQTFFFNQITPSVLPGVKS